MTTKAPSQVLPAPDSSIEHIAYKSVEGIPAVEPHDLDRLGYCVWLFLKHRRDSLDETVRNAGARLKVSEADAIKAIREKLMSAGVELG
jgi:hypothetical protein